MPKLSATYGLHEVDVAGHCLQILLDNMLILQIIVHDLCTQEQYIALDHRNAQSRHPPTTT